MMCGKWDPLPWLDTWLELATAALTAIELTFVAAIALEGPVHVACESQHLRL